MPKSYAVFDTLSRLCIEKDDAKDPKSQVTLIAREADRACYVKLDDYALREMSVHCAVLYEQRTGMKLFINTDKSPKTIQRESPPGIENVKAVFPGDTHMRVGADVVAKARIRQRVPVVATPVVPVRVRVRQPV